MPRTRDLRPGFFKNEDLAACEPLARILYQGLWTIADREGRLEDRPQKLKVEILPYDNCDIEALLDQLVKFNFIVRYESEGKKCIWIPTFTHNQRIHPKEPHSVLPCFSTAEPRQAAVLPGNSAPNRTIPSSPTIPTLPSLPPAPPKGEAKKKKTLVADDWLPSESFSTWLRENHPTVNEFELARELAKFKSYCKANGKTYADHDAALRNWFDSPFRKSGYTTQAQQKGSQVPASSIALAHERTGRSGKL